MPSSYIIYLGTDLCDGTLCFVDFLDISSASSLICETRTKKSKEEKHTTQ